MRRNILQNVMIVLITTSGLHTYAQQSAGASQLIKIHLEPTIQISAQTSDVVNIGFSDIAQYVQGVKSNKQLFKVHSNKDFVVSVKTDASAFSYSGSQIPAPQMQVQNTLFLAVEDNNTGGQIANSFNEYVSLSAMAKDLLLNCKNGGEKSFAVNYRANPGTGFPAGDYTVGVVYTATQP